MLSSELVGLGSGYQLKINSGCVKATFMGGLERPEMKISPEDSAHGHILCMEEVALVENILLISEIRFLICSQWSG